MSNAAKHRKKAAEFEQLKQIDRAIASYIRAIEDSESQGEDVDVVLLNKVGDLTLRQGRVADAVTYYERAVEHYAASGLFNNAIALCNKILRSAPGRANVYFTLGRICAKKGLRGDATRNFLEYATRMQQDGRIEAGMHALSDVADLMPELTEVRRLVDEHAIRAGVALPRRKTPVSVPAAENVRAVLRRDDKSPDLVFLDLGLSVHTKRNTPPLAPRVLTPPTAATSTTTPRTASGNVSLNDDILLFDPSRPRAVTPTEVLAAVTPRVSSYTILDLTIEPSLEALVAESLALTAEPVIESMVPLVPTDAIEGLESRGEFVSAGVLRSDDEPGDSVVTVLPDLVIEDFDHVADNPDAITVTGGLSGTPAYSQSIPRARTPLDVVPIPELEEAIEAGALTAAREDADAEVILSRTPLRLDPHDFILPGELHPLMVDDVLVDAGMRDERSRTPAFVVESSAFDDDVIDDVIDDAAPMVTPPYVTVVAEYAAAPADNADNDDEEAVEALRTAIETHRTFRTTPSLLLAAVAAEANVVATSRREELRLAVAETPQDWMLRRRLAEALFEVGEREDGLSELQAALSGFAQSGDLTAAADISDQLVLVSPERIQYHQKRVELAVRVSDSQRLRSAYLDLADTLVRSGDDPRAHAVYARVLELDPWDERARTALGAAAPPLPPAVSEEFVNLAEWLRDEAPGTTRMRMREPVVSGDEQADFEALLRHFKEGVSRSLGEEDYESHYDLGVAYKEMGLLDDAIAEFQKALRSRRHRLPAFEALGQCFVEQSRHSVAATVLTRALHEPGLGDEQRVGVLYLLAYSCEALQRRDEARSYYSRVYATDIHFRDVAARLAALDLVAR